MKAEIVITIDFEMLKRSDEMAERLEWLKKRETEMGNGWDGGGILPRDGGGSAFL